MPRARISFQLRSLVLVLLVGAVVGGAIACNEEDTGVIIVANQGTVPIIEVYISDTQDNGPNLLGNPADPIAPGSQRSFGFNAGTYDCKVVFEDFTESTIASNEITDKLTLTLYFSN